MLPFADARAESAMESEARLVMIDHGLPLPELQYTIRGANGVDAIVCTVAEEMTAAGKKCQD